MTKDILEKVFLIFLIVLSFLLICSIVALEIYCWVNYGGKNIEEIPFWALWFMWGK